MTMPINLVLVRHGQSEGNLANKQSRKGDHSAFTEEFKDKHSSLWRLTDKGVEQAKTAGIWMQRNIDFPFDRHYVSEYIRAQETAAHLGLEGSQWYKEFYLRERDWGALDVMSVEEREQKYADEMKRRERDGFYWASFGGESMANLCLRIDRVLNTLHRECSDKNVIVVCHGEVMWAFRVRLTRMTQVEYNKLSNSKHPHNKTHNCQIHHYSRRDPVTNELTPQYRWWRSICPTDIMLSSNEWSKIDRPTFGNAALLEEVEKVKLIVNG